MRSFLVFDLDHRRLALPLEQVRQTVLAVAITPLTAAPGVVEGVVDVHGTVTPVLDLRRRFGLEPRPVRLSDHLVLADAADRPVALRVDRVREVVTLPDEALTAARDDDPAMRHLAGIARLEDGMVLLHDLAAFLSQAEAEALDAALEREGREGREGREVREAAGGQR